MKCCTPHSPHIICICSFDGDGMIYACRMKNGKVSFSNRYVDTNRLRQEKAAGHPLGLKVILHTHFASKLAP